MRHDRLLCRVAMVIAFACAIAGLAACGGSEPRERPTPERWVEQADAICLDAERAISELVEPRLSDQQGLAAYMTDVANIGARQLEELRALVPPAGAEIDYRALLDISEKQVRVARDIADAARDGDPRRVTELVAAAESLRARADSIVARHGFEACGRSGQ